jgi:hypothetical protein
MGSFGSRLDIANVSKHGLKIGRRSVVHATKVFAHGGPDA